MTINTSASFRTLQGATQIVAQAFAIEAGIRVVFGNYSTGFFCKGKKGNKEVHIPSLPPNLEEAKIYSFGFLTHEIAHENYTDLDAFMAAFPKSPVKHAMLNILEDVRIEILSSNRYPGSRINLLRLIEKLVVEGKFFPYKPGYDPTNLMLAYTSTVLRSDLLGQATTQLAQFYSQDLADSISSGAKIKLDSLIYTIGDQKSTADVIVLVNQIFDMLKDEKQSMDNPQQPGDNQQQQSKDSGQGSSNSPSQPSGQGDDKSNQSSNDSDGQGQKAQGNDDGNQSNNSGNQSQNSDAEKNQDKDAQGKGGDQSKDDAKSDDSGNQSPSNDSKSNQDSADQGKGNGQGKDDSPSDNSESNNPSNGNSSNQDQSGQGNGNPQQSDNGPGGKNSTNIDSLLNGNEPVGDMDLGSIVSQQLNDIADLPENQRASVDPMLQEFQKTGVNSDLLSVVRGSSNATRIRILHLLEAQAKVKVTHSSSGLKLDPKRISRIVSGQLDVFKKTTKTVSQNTALVVLIDISGSMSSGNRYELALQSGLSVAMALEQAKGVDVAVYAFPFHGKVLNLTAFGERASGTSERYFNAKPNGGTPMSEAIMTASYDLLNQRNDRKLFLTVSDGQPENADSCKQVIESISDMGVEFMGLGIGVQLPDYFQTSRSISDINELSSTMFELLKQKLLGNRFN